MAAKLLTSPISHRCTFSTQDQHRIHAYPSWPGQGRMSTRQRNLVVGMSYSLDHALSSTSSLVERLHDPQPLFLLADSFGYSLASYYTSLGLFVISVPGLWSLIKRSVKSKGPYFHVFRFSGMMAPSRGQAALLTFCTCIILASGALVLTITFPDIGNNWFWLTILSPLTGAYYWTKASRKEQIKVRMLMADDGTLSEIIVQSDDQKVEQTWKELKMSEKGMVSVKGIFER